MSRKLRELLEECVKLGASDLHVSSDMNAYLRVWGQLVAASPDPIPRGEVEAMVASLLDGERRAAFDREGTADLAFSIEGGDRFRCHVYREMNGPALAIRRLESRFRSLAELNLPVRLAELAELRDGLVLFAGPAGSGKSTTLATLLDLINGNRACHILTIEDPIEYVHGNKKGMVHQRELGRDAPSFAEAVRSSLRENPDVLLVGEMRDAETMRAAIMVAETGHLVFSTLHCGGAVGALDRIVGAFPPGERESLCQQLSMTLRAVVVQRLLPRADAPGLIPAVEMLRVTKAVANLIRQHKSEQIYSVMENGGEEGMLTLEQSLADLVAGGKIRIETARIAAGNPQALERRIASRCRNPDAIAGRNGHAPVTGLRP
ncbi:MAG: PilT/PilU family type 4a pilus ATPase [Planctomycetota bacterium]|nr:PilT/PilU family type 4a pilus ATPase [Planctomycetota bacterium]